MKVYVIVNKFDSADVQVFRRFEDAVNHVSSVWEDQGKTSYAIYERELLGELPHRLIMI